MKGEEEEEEEEEEPAATEPEEACGERRRQKPTMDLIWLLLHARLETHRAPPPPLVATRSS